MMATDRWAMTRDVENTRPNPREKIYSFLAQKSFQDVVQAASKSNGGRKIKKMISGFKLTLGTAGINGIASPPSTSRIG
ncbi:hypothetical protein DYBT9275_04921 [Dyadobacter sp. CECT 9275]|uniref:Uncharacterized protein n=1 Tax=Dyadobacter helix TaxID=2822344 RepID=A0A916NDJ9_9BACT|nr:hypothetical protein DYBT9275_04921 [Dyadobacter sp. CECT 9275]